MDKVDSDARLFFLFTAERGDWENHVTEQTLYISDVCRIIELNYTPYYEK